MAKQDKEKSKPDKAKSPADAAEGVPGRAKKPNLLKRIVKTIESISKDKKASKTDAKERKARDRAAASRQKSLGQAASGLSEPASTAESVPVPEPGSDPQAIAPASTVSEAAPQPAPGNAVRAVPPRWDATEAEKDSKKPSEMTNEVVSSLRGSDAPLPPPVMTAPLPSADAGVAEAKAAKFEIEPPTTMAARKPVVPPDLRDQVFATRLVILVRDPESLYAYWDVTDDDRKLHRLDSLVPPRQMALRLHDHGRDAKPTPHALVYVDFLLQPGVDSRYLRLPLKDRWWRADLGVKDEKTGFTVLARSNLVRSPRDHVAEWSGGAAHPGRPQPHSAPSAAERSVTAGGEFAQRSRAQIFENTFRLSGGMSQPPGATEEVIGTETKTWSVLRVRQVGSSGQAEETEELSETALKVRRLGASDLSSRQG